MSTKALTNGKGNGYIVPFAEQVLPQTYNVSLVMTIQAWCTELVIERGTQNTWTQLATLAGLAGLTECGYLDTTIWQLQQDLGLTTVSYRATPMRGVEVGVPSAEYVVTLPILPRLERIWPRHETAITDILQDVRRMTGDRLGVIVSDDELCAEMNEAIGEAWPTYGELWRYTLACDRYAQGRWYIRGQVEQAVPWAVRYLAASGTDALLISRYNYDHQVLTVPAFSMAREGAVQFEVMIPPCRPDQDPANTTTTVSRRYVVLATARRVLDIIAERTGIDILDRSMALDFQLQQEQLRSGGGPSRDSMGVARG